MDKIRTHGGGERTEGMKHPVYKRGEKTRHPIRREETYV